jgi:hypothetical protein
MLVKKPFIFFFLYKNKKKQLICYDKNNSFFFSSLHLCLIISPRILNKKKNYRKFA